MRAGLRHARSGSPFAIGRLTIWAPVNLTVLSRSAEIYTTRRIVEAGRARGVAGRVIDPLQVELALGECPRAYWRRRRLPRSDVVVPRIGLSVHQYGLAVVTQLELMGIAITSEIVLVAASDCGAR